MATDRERLYTRADIRAWREGCWYFVSLGGELVYQRYTRDEAFDVAWVLFHNNQSPSLPQTGKNFDRVVLRGPWKVGYNSSHQNRIEVPIERPGEPSVKPKKKPTLAAKAAKAVQEEWDW